MSRELKFTTQLAATTALGQINARFKSYCNTAGYTDDGASVYPKECGAFADKSTGQKTTDIASVTGSGSDWRILHPEYHTMRRSLVPGIGSSFQTYVLQDISSPTIVGTAQTYDYLTEAVAGWSKYSQDSLANLGGSFGVMFDAWVIKESATYIMYVSSRNRSRIERATSSDGINWSAPTGCLATDALGATSRCSVVHKPDDTWHMWYTVQQGTTMWINYAKSSDGGVTFTKDTANVLTATETWETQVSAAVSQPIVLWDAGASKFKMWYSAGDSYEPFAVGYAESSNGTTWTKEPTNPVFGPDTTRVWEQNRVAGGHVLVDGGYYVMFYISYESGSAATISVARSLDGKTNWERHANNPLIRRSPLADKQSAGGIYRPTVVKETGGWKMWFNGINISLNPSEAIMLATKSETNLYW